MKINLTQVLNAALAMLLVAGLYKMFSKQTIDSNTNEVKTKFDGSILGINS